MSTSTSNLPAIILAVVIVASLVAFYIADRGSSPDIANITHHADVDKMIASKQKYETQKSMFDHSGYSGSLQGYLEHAKNGSSAEARVVKKHIGYSGSGKSYMQKYNAELSAKLQANAREHSGFNGSIKKYLGGDYSYASVNENKQRAGSASSTAATTGYSGSVDKYLKKYGN